MTEPTLPVPAEQPDPERLLALKDQLFSCWQQLPDEHKASMGLVLINDLANGEYFGWLMGALLTRFDNQE
jgi:hypothetical protein